MVFYLVNGVELIGYCQLTKWAIEVYLDTVKIWIKLNIFALHSNGELGWHSWLVSIVK